MNNKGLTLVELLLVIVIIGIIGAITIPNIMEAYSESRRKGGETVEDILIENLQMYNKDYEIDLWAEGETGDKIVSIQDLYSMNPDIDMGECLLQNSNSLVITKDSSGNYTYKASIICSRNFDSKTHTTKIATSSELNNEQIYYKTA